MNAIPFDTLKMARKLEAAGFPGPQAAGAAEAMAEAMSGAELATKADLQWEIGHVQIDMTAMEPGCPPGSCGQRAALGSRAVK